MVEESNLVVVEAREEDEAQTVLPSKKSISDGTDDKKPDDMEGVVLLDSLLERGDKNVTGRVSSSNSNELSGCGGLKTERSKY